MIFDANVRMGRLAAGRGPHFDQATDLLPVMDRFGVAQALVYHALARGIGLPGREPDASRTHRRSSAAHPLLGGGA